MILPSGSKILLAHRRLFDQDHARFFVGLVEDYENGIARITGHTWVRDGYRGTFQRKSEVRTKIISISSGTVIVYLLPASVRMEGLNFWAEGSSQYLGDDAGFRMDLTEGAAKGAAVG